MDIQKNIEYLYALTRFGIKPGLDTIRRLGEALNNPQNSYPIIHIAGTNGKGSTCAILNSVLISSGYKVGLYTSPHLVHFGERIRVNNQPLTDEGSALMVEELKPMIDSTGATFFEATTAMAFLQFARSGVEVAVVETGLGGKLDATNIVHPALTVFTPISFDHTERLGSELSTIARDKAGIIKRSCPVVSSLQTPEALDEIKKSSHFHQCDLYYAPDVIEYKAYSLDARGITTTIACNMDAELDGEYHLPLPGRHQLTNLQTALTGMVLLIKRGYNISRDSARRGIENSHWHGRLQILKEDPLVYYDVAHNPAAAQALSDFLREIFPARKAKVIMGMMKDKDAGNFIRNLIPIAKEFIFVDLNNPRGLEPYLLSEAAQAEGVPFKVIPEAGEAINVVMCEALEEEIILITGSHYLGEAVYNFFGLQNT